MGFLNRKPKKLGLKVFADYHHGGLYHALYMLFVERLGCELYRPVGLEWVNEGIWRYSENPPTQRQYLALENHELRKDGYYYWRDNSEEIDHKCLTFEQFQEMPIDIIIGSVCQHELSFFYLQRKYKPKAKFIRLLGNSGEPIDFNVSRNIMDTTNLYPVPAGCTRVVLRQEFPVHLFYYTPPPKEKRIRQYLNCFNETPYYSIWHDYKKILTEFEWKMHGLNGDDGFITPVSALAQSMRETSFFWHIKQHGEGFGHIIHNAFAVGRPVITVKNYYRGKMVYPMLVDGVTCIDLQNKSVAENVGRIRYFSEPERLRKMCETARDWFKKFVNYDREEEMIRRFLERLV